MDAALSIIHECDGVVGQLCGCEAWAASGCVPVVEPA